MIVPGKWPPGIMRREGRARHFFDTRAEEHRNESTGVLEAFIGCRCAFRAADAAGVRTGGYGAGFGSCDRRWLLPPDPRRLPAQRREDGARLCRVRLPGGHDRQVVPDAVEPWLRF